MVEILNSRKSVNFLDGKINTVGENIQNRRKELHLSRQKLSNELILIGIDVNAQSIYDIERGIRTIVDYELCAIAKVLDISVDCLLKDFKNKLDEI